MEGIPILTIIVIELVIEHGEPDELQLLPSPDTGRVACESRLAGLGAGIVAETPGFGLYAHH